MDGVCADAGSFPELRTERAEGDGRSRLQQLGADGNRALYGARRFPNVGFGHSLCEAKSDNLFAPCCVQGMKRSILQGKWDGEVT